MQGGGPIKRWGLVFVMVALMIFVATEEAARLHYEEPKPSPIIINPCTTQTCLKKSKTTVGQEFTKFAAGPSPGGGN